MDRISKALKKLSEAERKTVSQILVLLERREFNNLEIKKLKGHADIFRVRKGKIRIIYRLNKTNDFFILAIEHRNDTTYRKF